MNFTKKQLNAIKHTAFEEFKAGFSADELSKLFNQSGICLVAEIVESGSDKVVRGVFQHETQINKAFAEANGMSWDNVTYKILFRANRQTKCIF